ncbi:hypothetical protein L3Q82_025704 [Scortum barcoo]|uniref:Uncharacterized protein n=1 Tax=Scortum barcoo TaxID=214431 RepID=A0ACB8WM14_9TELE|nr:hypothetical protein L3Q82_025704 [Scortum barcoo]
MSCDRGNVSVWCSWSAVVMEEEMQQLRELMLQLKADNERLRQEQVALLEGSGGVSSPAPVSNAPSAGASAVVTERLVVIPRDPFFSRHQLEGETLQEFSLALMALMDRVKQCAPDGVPNADVLLRDQFIEHVYDSSLRRELKQLVRRQPMATMLELRSEAIRWEREGLPGGARPRSSSLPSAYGLQYAVQGRFPTHSS